MSGTVRAEGPRRLLLVDDEPHICAGLRRILYKDGYEIHVASGAREAFEVLGMHPIDVIVSDQRMPLKKGTELLAEVQELYPRTVRMILSGAADVDEVARAMEAGAIYKFLTKPINPALLRANVGEAFSRAAALQADAGRAERAADPITGLASRAHLESVYPDLVAKAQREGQLACLLMLKVDQYDNVLSSFGYSFGRKFLRGVAAVLDGAFGRSYHLAHDSPGTFLLLTASSEPADRITAVDDEIDELFARPIEAGEHSITATLTIGAASAGTEMTFDELVDQTHAAMKTGSERGGATMQFYQPHLINAFRGQLELESDLRQATMAGSFLLYYQPQVDLTRGRVVGLEALLRWPHPLHGFVSPQQFVPMAERIGLIGELGAWVLDTAVAQLAAWRDAGIAFDELAINVSALQLKKTAFAGRIGETLERYGWPPERLVLEITESAAIEQQRSIVDCLEALREIGVVLAVDDFGTGYANLANLTRVAFSKLKIDRSLLPTPEDERGKRLYAHVVRIARELGLAVVAEGVETEAELAIVRDAGCSVVQGYFFSAPVSPDRLVETLARSVRGKGSCTNSNAAS